MKRPDANKDLTITYFVVEVSWKYLSPAQVSTSYVRNLRSNSKPYTLQVRDAKKWQTRKGAQRWIDLKDPGFAKMAKVVAIDILPPL